MRFESPWFLVLLVALPVVLRRGRREPALQFPSTAGLHWFSRSRRQLFLALPFGLIAAALALFVVAMARPQLAAQRVRQPGKGIAIEMVIDRSSSMNTAVQYRSKRMTRLDLAKRMFREFALGNGSELRGRSSDVVGAIAFALYPETICPLTFDTERAVGILPLIQAATAWTHENRTAIGDAVALAAARLRNASHDGQPVRTKVVILLTDGENNAGETTVAEAAELAASWGVRVYVIGIFDQLVRVYNDLIDRLAARERNKVDRQLAALAEKTGGLYRTVQDSAVIRPIYTEIDRMEKSDLAKVQFVNGRELAPEFVTAGVFLLCLAAVLSCTILRRIP